jgi:hypothetical protein
VDDILAHVDKQEAENLGKKLIERFGTMPIKDSSRLSYLGDAAKNGAAVPHIPTL